MKKVGIFGATGYAGIQLISLLKGHPEVEIKFATSNKYKGEKFSSIYPKFIGYFDNILIDSNSAFKELDDLDLLFLALPHTVSMNYIKDILKIKKDLKIIDLSGDFRLNNQSIYEKFYKTDHILSNYLEKFIYGLPEINREKIKNSNYVSNPGCYPTSAILPLYPLVKDGIIDKNDIIIDAKSGLSGAGRKAHVNYLFTESADNTYAYNTNQHRHQPEINEKLLDANVLFNPHIVPSTRGIYSTIYCKLNENITEEEIEASFKNFYKDSFFVTVTEDIPKTKDVIRTNNCRISFRYDKINNRLVLFSAIDNLMKGASSQAIQNMNLMLGFKEELSIENNLFYI